MWISGKHKILTIFEVIEIVLKCVQAFIALLIYLLNKSDTKVTKVNVDPFEIIQNQVIIQICYKMDSLHTSKGWCIQEVQRGDINILGVHFLIHSLGQGTPVKHAFFFVVYAQFILPHLGLRSITHPDLKRICFLNSYHT